MKEARKLAASFVWTLPIFYGLWLFFTGTFSEHELAIGIFAALLASSGMLVVTLSYSIPFQPSFGDLLAFWRLPWSVVSDTWITLLVAAKDIAGIRRAESIFQAVPFRAGRMDDPRATARRALAVLYSTVSPNSIVLGINVNNQEMLVHQIRRSPVPKMTKELGAKA